VIPQIGFVIPATLLLVAAGYVVKRLNEPTVAVHALGLSILASTFLSAWAITSAMLPGDLGIITAMDPEELYPDDPAAPAASQVRRRIRAIRGQTGPKAGSSPVGLGHWRSLASDVQKAADGEAFHEFLVQFDDAMNDPGLK